MIFEYPTYLILGCILLSAGYALFLYLNTKAKSTFGTKRWWLAGLRFTAVLMLSFLLLKPLLISTKKINLDPIVVLVKDVSNSLYDSADSLQYNAAYNKVVEALDGKADVKELQIAQTIQPQLSHAERKATNLGQLKEYLDNAYDNSNLVTTVLFSDGLYNQGQNPVYLASDWQQPLYTVIEGDTQTLADVWIKSIQANDNVISGNVFEAQINLMAQSKLGQQGVLRVWFDDSLSYEKNIKINATQFSKNVSVYIVSDGVGSKAIKAQWSVDDVNQNNNNLSRYIEVVATERNVLFLFDAPHPDVNAIGTALNKGKNTKVDFVWAKEAQIDWSLYDGVISHSLFKPRNTTLLQGIKNQKIPHFAILGSTVDGTLLNTFGQGLKVSESIGEPLRYTVAFNEAFSAFSIDDATQQFLENIKVPLLGEYSNFELANSAVPLTYMTFDGLQTEDPIMMYNDAPNGIRSVYWQGEGYWQWRMLDFRLNKNFNAFDELVQKSADFFISKADKERIQVDIDDYWFETEWPEVYFRVLDQNGSSTTQAACELTLKNELGESIEVQYFKRVVDYKLDVSILPPGQYILKVKAQLGNENLIKEVKFSVLPFDLEKVEQPVNDQLLKEWAFKTGGKAFYLSQTDLLIQELDQLNYQREFYVEKDYHSLIEQWWYIVLAFVLLAIEWFFRKFWGGY